jgi:hypothetical protein
VARRRSTSGWPSRIADRGPERHRFDKRKLLCATQIAAGTLACAFGVLVSTGATRMWMMYVLALGLGFVNVFDNPARQAPSLRCSRHSP